MAKCLILQAYFTYEGCRAVSYLIPKQTALNPEEFTSDLIGVHANANHISQLNITYYQLELHDKLISPLCVAE